MNHMTMMRGVMAMKKALMMGSAIKLVVCH